MDWSLIRVGKCDVSMVIRLETIPASDRMKLAAIATMRIESIQHTVANAIREYVLTHWDEYSDELSLYASSTDATVEETISAMYLSQCQRIQTWNEALNRVDNG